MTIICRHFVRKSHCKGSNFYPIINKKLFCARLLKKSIFWAKRLNIKQAFLYKLKTSGESKIKLKDWLAKIKTGAEAPAIFVRNKMC
jgi:hypothetical protein